MATPTHAESTKALRADLGRRSTKSLQALLNEIRTGPAFWGNGALEVEVIVELRIRAAREGAGYA